MNPGISLIIYPVSDLGRAKAFYATLPGVKPDAESAYYVGCRVGDQEIGLTPNVGNQAGPLCYRPVGDIEASLKSLLAAGAVAEQPVRDVGGGRMVASIRDADGNVIGLIQG